MVGGKIRWLEGLLNCSFRLSYDVTPDSTRSVGLGWKRTGCIFKNQVSLRHCRGIGDVRYSYSGYGLVQLGRFLTKVECRHMSS